MLGILANHHNFALALDDLALLAHGLDGRSYFHRFTSCFAARRRSLVQRAYAALPGALAPGGGRSAALGRYGAALLASPGDPAAGQIIRGHLDSHLISREDPDIVHSELTRNGGQDGVAFPDIYQKIGVGQCLFYDTLQFNHICFRQELCLLFGQDLMRGRLPTPAAVRGQ